MTHDPYTQPPSGDSASSPNGTPPYQQGSSPGVPPYQEFNSGSPQSDPYGAPGGYQQGGYQQDGYQQGSQQGGYQQYQQGPNQQYPGPQRPLAPGEDRTWSILSHLAGVVGALISVGWLGFVGPLVIYLVFKDRSPRVRAASAGAFNFALTLWIVNIAAFICAITIILLPVAIILWVGGVVALFVCHIMGAVKAANDEPYNYPLQIPILK